MSLALRSRPKSRSGNKLEALSPTDDWSGITNSATRRRLQNRLNQRAYRFRREAKERKEKLPESATDAQRDGKHFDSASGSAESHSGLASISCRLSTAQHIQCTFAPPNIHELIVEYETRAMENFIQHSPKVDELIKLSRLNILRAAYENAVAIGMTVEWMCRDDTVSIFNHIGPDLSHDAVPLDLRATPLQKQIPHHPWLDVFPFPRMRDNLIMAGNTLDDDELCHDLTGFWDTRHSDATLLVWGTPWDPKNWEVTEAFCRKWGWVLRGCPDILISTNKWRRKRGERRLQWHQFMSY